MASLIEKSALGSLLPLSAGSCTLAAQQLEPITSIAPFRGVEDKVGARLRAVGLDWPKPNRAVVAGDSAILWGGRDKAFLIGRAPDGLPGLAALTDQSDGWATMSLSGRGAVDVLARLVAVDLRPGVFPVGHVVRTGLNHMMSVLWRRTEDSMDIMVFRSMAETAVHELHMAMKAVAARAAL